MPQCEDDSNRAAGLQVVLAGGPTGDAELKSELKRWTGTMKSEGAAKPACLQTVISLLKGKAARTPRRPKSLLAAMGIAGLALGGIESMPAAQAQTGPAAAAFLPHRAVYDLSLLKSRRSPAVDAARGRILYNFKGSACEGYTTQFRQVSEVISNESSATLADLQSTSFEDAESKTYRFRVESKMNNKDVSIVDGVAERSADGVSVRLKEPANKTIRLGPDIVFPTQQVARIIKAAREGKSLLELSVYDGSDNGEKVYKTLTVIGAPIAPDAPQTDNDAATGKDGMTQSVRWPVTVSYYDSSEPNAKGEQTPVYAMSFQLYDNGVSRALKLDYNEFVIAGKISSFETYPVKPCK